MLNILTHLDVWPTWLQQGRWNEAEKLNADAMELRKQLLGAEHPDTLRSMGNLAATYSKQGRLEKAETLNNDIEQIRNGKKSM